MADLISMLSACGATEGEATDADFQNTVLLLHGDGTNGAQNNTFLDSSTNNFTITRNGNTTQGSFSPFSKPDGRWGNFFDGNGDYLSLAASAQFLPGVNTDFNFEAWVYLTATPSASNAQVVGTGEYGTSSDWVIGINSSLVPFFYINTSPGTDLTSSTAISTNTWNHIAVSRSGTASNNVKLFLNGVVVAQASTNVTLDYSGNNLTIGADENGDESNLTGYVSNVRLVNGSAVYTAAFTPPTSPLTAVTNTVLLTCQSNRFKDNSTNNFTITRNGDVRVTPFSPFPITTAYDPAVNGGSGYFDGSGDYLTLPNNSAFAFGTGAYTIETWVYLLAYEGASGNSVVFDSGNATNSLGFFIGGGLSVVGQLTLNKYGSGQVFGSGVNNVPLSAWTHIAISREGTGTNQTRMFANGVLVATGTDNNNWTVTTTPTIGSLTIANYDTNGYFANTRIVKGTAVYTSAFTPPTAPLTAIANTSLLCNFTNAGIFDNTGFNNLETVADAQIDTSVKKYGTGSMEFDGTGDYLLMNGGENFAFGTGDFTVEFWYYSNNTGSQQLLYDSRPSGTNGNYITFYKSSSNVLELYVNNSVRATGSTSIASGTWYHVALCRSGTSTRMFLNGTQEGSTYTDSTNYLNGANRPAIGTDGNTLGNLPLNGYIDDLRITKGIARYTSAFTPPTAAFPDIGE